MNTIVREKNCTIPQRSTQMFFDGHYGVYREDHFIEMLVFERKRSERSGKPFVLMTLTILEIGELQRRSDIIRGAVEALSVFNRETDIKGWYRDASTLGVIVTETDSIDTDTLHDKVCQRLHAQLSEEQIDSINISFHTAPSDESSAIPDSPGDFTFHRDYLEKKDPKISQRYC